MTTDRSSHSHSHADHAATAGAEPAPSAAFVTGATGLVGRWLVPALTRRGRRVIALVRDADRRRADFLAWVADHGGDPAAVSVVAGDLSQPELGLAPDDRARALTARDIYHLGALMAFGADRDQSRAANVAATRAVLDLATEAPGLRRLVHLSGFRLVGGHQHRHHGIDPDGPYRAADYDRLYRRLGAYEASKMEADHLVRDRAAARAIPLTVINPGGVIGDSRTGETVQSIGFAALVEMLYRGKMPAVPGGRHTWLPLITVDFLADFLARVPEAPDAAGQDYALLDDRTPALAELLGLVARHLGVHAPRRRIPLALARRLQPSRREELGFLTDQRYDTAPTQRMAHHLGLTLPDIVTSALRSAEHVVASRFLSAPREPGASVTLAGGAATFVRRRGLASDPGAAPRFVLLHGLPLDADSWRAVEEHLPGPSLAPDLAGLGRSAPSAAAPGEWLASLLAGELAGGAAPPPIVVGHSLGTWFAVDYAARHPDRVGGLVLVSPYFLQAPPPAIVRRRAGAALAARLIRRRHLESLLTGDPRGTSPLLDGPLTWLDRPGARARFGRALAAGHQQRDRLRATLARVAATVPTVLVVGERDPLVGGASAANLPVRIIDVAASGHYPQLDRPDLVAGAAAELAAAAAATRAAADPAHRSDDTISDAYRLPSETTMTGKETSSTSGTASQIRP